METLGLINPIRIGTVRQEIPDSCLNLYPSNSKPPNMPSPYPIVFGKVKTLPRSTKNNNNTKDHIQNLASELKQDLVDRKKKTGSNGLLNWNDL
mgnify:CR=1 FL=1